MAVPASARIKGLLLWLQKKEGKAVAEWKRGISEASKRALYVEQGKCHYDLGRFADPTRPRRTKHIQEAMKIFQDRGCEVWLSSCKIEIEVNNKAQAEHAERIIASKHSKDLKDSKVKLPFPGFKFSRGSKSSA